MSETTTPCRPGCERHVDCVIAAWREPDGVFAPHPEEIAIIMADRDRFRLALERIRDLSLSSSDLAVMEMKGIAKETLGS